MSETPAWLEKLVNLVVDGMEPHTVIGPVGYRYHQNEEDGVWEVMVYLTPIELADGRDDGTVVTPGFYLDLRQLQDAFEDVDYLYWHVHGLGSTDLDRPSVALEGHCQGHRVYLQVLAYAPDDEPPTLTLDTPQPEPGQVH